jgi:subtilase family serine protease
VGTATKTKCKVKVVLKDAKGVVQGTDASDNFFTIEPLLPDLIETSVTNPPAAALVGSSFSATDTVSNQGEKDAGPSITRYYLSVDTVKGSGDILLTGSRSVPSLAPGLTSTAVADVTIPSGTALGAYYLLACADNTKVVAESDETNNCIASSSTVQVRAPDLIETSVSNPPPTSSPESTFSVTDTVKNQGNADAGSSITRYYLSVDTAKGSGDILLTGSRSVPSLAPGVDSTAAVNLTIPSSTTLGVYYLLACADGTKVVAESDETNNCIASSSTVQIRVPDLIETFVSNPPQAARAGSIFSVTDTVRNRGGVAAGPSVTQYYLSKNTTKGSGDILLIGGRYVIGLAPGATSTAAVNVMIPGTAVGAYYLLACADDMKVVVESNETNNCIASSSTVQVNP